MKKKYVKPTIETIDMPTETLLDSSKHGKPGHGWGAGGHYGPPG